MTKPIKIWCTFLSILLALISTPPLCIGAETAPKKPTIEEVKKETQEYLRVLKSYSVAQRDEAVAKTEAELAELDASLEELEAEIDANWEEMSKAARAEANATLRELHKLRNEVAEEYGRMQASSAAAWEEMKKGFSKAYVDLQEAWEKAEKEFGKK